MSKHVVGIDIGSAAIRAVEVARVGHARPSVRRYHEIALPEGAVVNGEVVEVNTVAAVLKQLWSAGRFRSRKVILGVGNSKVLVRDLTVPRLNVKEIRASLPAHSQGLIPVPAQEALLDFYPISEAPRRTAQSSTDCSPRRSRTPSCATCKQWSWPASPRLQST